jgi:hypothetical protein
LKNPLRRPRAIEREVVRETAQIQAAALSDLTKSYTNDPFDDALEALTKFARERADLVWTENARYR